MAVLNAIVLPGQPSGQGNVRLTVLGGDGNTAPFAMYTVENAQITMDVSAGLASITVEMDDRYVSLVTYLTLSIHQQTPAVNKAAKIDLQGGPEVGTWCWQGEIQSQGSNFAPECCVTWQPPCTLLVGGTGRTSIVRFQTTNDIVGDELEADMQVLLFNNDVRQKVPLYEIYKHRGPVASVPMSQRQPI